MRLANFIERSEIVSIRKTDLRYTLKRAFSQIVIIINSGVHKKKKYI